MEHEGEDDTAVPKWPKYDNPTKQKAEIDKELSSVSKTVEHWKKLHADAQKTLNDKSVFQGLAEQKKKQKEMDL